MQLVQITKEEVRTSRTKAESSRAKYTTLQGVFRWEPVRLSTSLMSFRFLGRFPESSISLVFEIPKKGSSITCRARIDPSLYRPRSGRAGKLSPSAASCLKKLLGATLKRHSSSPLKSPSEIGPLLLKLDRQFGRLEQLALEHSDIERQHETNTLFLNANASVEVEFSGCVATFEMSDRYPFEPMNMRIDIFEGKEIDIVGFRRHLVKYVKPGHRYLSRLCDCMEAYLSQ